MPSIENGSDGENITVAESGLLTPSKSQRSATPKISAFDTLQSKGKGKSQAQKGPGRKPKTTAPKKQTTGKVGRPAKPKATKQQQQQQQKPLKPASASLKASFASSKGGVADMESKALATETKLAPPPYPLPSKLSQVSSISYDTLHPLSPSDARNNLSPTNPRNIVSKAQGAKGVEAEESPTRTMSLASVMN